MSGIRSKKVGVLSITPNTAVAVVGVLLVVVGLTYRPLAKYLSERATRPQTDPGQVGNVYDHGPISADEALLRGSYSDGSLPQRIVIPSVSIDLPVEGARVVAGRWEIFEDRASFGLGSSLPGEAGNSVIFAHARQALFGPLRSVKPGARVYVLVGDKVYTYEIKEMKEVFPSDTSVIWQTTDSTLTLYTCSGFADTKRLIVTAKRV